MTSAPTNLDSARAEVVQYAQRLTSDGLVVGTSGNISLRVDDLIAVTPSGVDYATMTPEDIPVVRLDGTVVAGSLKPTSELPMHLRCYADSDAAAVVHTHSAAATALSLLRDEVPLVHYQLAMFGGQVRVAPYCTYGTPELADAMAAALRGRSATILANHGTIAYSHSLGHAFDKVSQLEWLCDVWLRAAAVGSPREISPAELDRVVEKFGTYGQPRPA
ncbi:MULTISPECIES: class II aldolase/adducin family protein [Mycolicibacterium]|uniref:Ribulose-5-phosphate 4-epimerase-like epimerase or aldolase n=2 Tax=Mycolicibacterium TaxID=1866885 RepID=A0A378T9C5_9MYCO|nr:MULTISPECIES: class II aldolase/adducin family protein [Mycolicibacterium]MCV7183239.1 class II aldolase/adducin family protein [Mycolicibacterium murale]BBY88718.1 fuculose phosphate aldolase [Mycolicibacterium tokaiense]GFG59964.1 fuculose phosphate aldolase [Mycolicibacterium murale]STZ56757.1 ribulose-5-phosphate 4-epimerase-like epimerase or aldolase [Mycolicibacterium tokaiense]